MKKLIAPASGASLMAVALAAAIAAPSPAEAAIRCKGAYQVNKYGDSHYAPYCADNLLAAVAREYGMRVSNYAVRQNPSVKAQACRLVGHDIRVKDNCQQYRPDGNRFR